MLEQNWVQCRLDLRIARLERLSHTGLHLTMLGRQWAEHYREGRAVDIYCGQRVAHVVAAPGLSLGLQARPQHTQQIPHARAGPCTSLRAVAVLLAQV